MSFFSIILDSIKRFLGLKNAYYSPQDPKKDFRITPVQSVTRVPEKENFHVAQEEGIIRELDKKNNTVKEDERKEDERKDESDFDLEDYDPLSPEDRHSVNELKNEYERILNEKNLEIKNLKMSLSSKGIAIPSEMSRFTKTENRPVVLDEVSEWQLAVSSIRDEKDNIIINLNELLKKYNEMPQYQSYIHIVKKPEEKLDVRYDDNDPEAFDLDEENDVPKLHSALKESSTSSLEALFMERDQQTLTKVKKQYSHTLSEKNSEINNLKKALFGTDFVIPKDIEEIPVKKDISDAKEQIIAWQNALSHMQDVKNERINELKSQLSHKDNGNKKR